MTRTHPKTYFVTRLSEDFVVKAGGEKGSEAYWSTSRTFLADNADPRKLQPIAVNRGLGMGSRFINLFGLFGAVLSLCLCITTRAQGGVTPISSKDADFEFIWSSTVTDGSGDWYNTTFNRGRLENKRNEQRVKSIYMLATFTDAGGNPTIGADIIIPDGQGSISSGAPGNENLAIDPGTGSRMTVEQSWTLTQCPEYEIIDLSLLLLDIQKLSTGSPELRTLVVRTKCHPIPVPGAIVLGCLGCGCLPLFRRFRV